MNLQGWSDRDREGLRSFYESGHAWSWQDLENGATPMSRSARDWIETCPPPRAHPALLPRVFLTGDVQVTHWYAVAFSERQAEELRDHLSAFVGPSGTDFSGRRADLDPVDMAESALEAWAGGPWVYRFGAIQGKQKIVRAALERLRRVWRIRPELSATVLRTTEALLRDFFSALLNQDETGALRWMAELRVGGRLSAENLVFLEIERLGAFGRWRELAAKPEVALLQSMRRPRNVTALLIEALWRSELAELAASKSVEEVAEYFREKFFPRHQHLLRARGGLSNVPVVLTFLLAAVTSDPPRREQIPILLKELPACPETPFAEALAALVEPATEEADPSESALEFARAAFLNDDYDTAWQRLQEAPVCVASCSLMLECAHELQSESAARLVSDGMERLSQADRDSVFKSLRRRQAWEALQRFLAPADSPPPKDWDSWLDRNDKAPDWPRLLETARQSSVAWRISDYLDAPNRIQKLADRLLAERSESSETNLRLAFPHIASFFLKDGAGTPAFLPVYQNLFLLLGISESFSAEDCVTVQTLLVAVLDAGVEERVYREIVESGVELWKRFGGYARIDWAMDILDLLACYPAAAPSSRDAFFNAVRDSLSRDHRRVRPEHWELFRLLASDLGRTEDYDAICPRSDKGSGEESEAGGLALSDCMVAIYTLTESVGRRAKMVIEKMFPKVDVRLAHDHVGSERLRSLAREADYLIISTRSAKHAATEYLKEERPGNKPPPIYPLGKGSSSIVTALLSAVV